MSKLGQVAHQVHGLVVAYTPPGGGVQPPGTDKINTIVQWAMWAASAALFVFFIFGLVKAGRARKNAEEADVSAPVWPLIASVILGGSGTIWAAIGG